MDRKKIVVFVITGVLVMGILAGAAAFLKGKFGKKEYGEISPSEAVIPQGVEYPGKLVGVSYDFSGGSMEYFSDLQIDVMRGTIISSRAFSERRRDWVSRNGVEIKEKKWEELEKLILILYPHMTEFDPDSQISQEDEEIIELDGGSRNILILTWEKNGFESSVRYIQDSDRRFLTLSEFLRELADPAGRKVTWYKEPEICGIYLNDDDRGLYFQLTPDGDPDGEYRFISGGTGADLDVKTDPQFFRPVAEYLEGKDLEGLESGWRFHDPVTLTVYIDDGTQNSYIPDGTMLIELTEMLKKMAEGCLGE